MVELDGDPFGTICMRKFACRYLSGMVGVRPFRDAISRAVDSADFRDIVERLFPPDPENASREEGAALAAAAVSDPARDLGSLAD